MEQLKINKAAEIYISEVNGMLGDVVEKSDCRDEMMKSSFKVGASWALDNQWIDAKKELPDVGVKVIVLTNKGNVVINSVCVCNGKKCWHSNYEVKYWMYAPKLEKEETL